jgi:homoserine dehydrogenase
MAQAVRIGIAGLGTVGQGVVSIIQQHSALLAARHAPIEIAAVSMRDRSKARKVSLEGIRIEDDALALADASDVDIVLELIGGEDGIARQLVERSIAQGKHVVTANKALIAHHGDALVAHAETQGVVLAFEAAVAGGIPILSTLRHGTCANQISRISGILNGTCNFILTTMEQEGRDFDDVLNEAEALGYLEADPALDIDGIDTAHKVAILAALAFGTRLDYAGVDCEGIRNVTLRDMHYAAEFGYRIKLLGMASFDGRYLHQSVRPTLVPLSAPLAGVSGAFNAVQLHGDAVGDVTLEGRGAGAGPTASAVLADVMAIARGERPQPFGMAVGALIQADRSAGALQKSAYYLRLNVRDEPGVLAEITRIFANEHISVRAITQHEIMPDNTVQVVVSTHHTDDTSMRAAMSALSALPVNANPPICLGISEGE